MVEVAVQVNGPYEHVMEIARIAETAGFSALALSDHYLEASEAQDFSRPADDTLAQMAALSRETSRIDLLTLVSPITFRHPAVYAKTMTTIDRMSGGRFSLGLGTGWHEDEHAMFGIPFPTRRARFELLEDALGYLQAFIQDPEAGYEGSHFRFGGFDVRPRARADTCIVVGGTGPERTPRLAGRFAGEYNLSIQDPSTVAHRIGAVRRSAIEAGRDPASIRMSTPYRMIAGDDDAEVDDFLAEWGAPTGRTVGDMRAYVGQRIPILGWDDHMERIDRLGSIGFDRVYVKVVTKSVRAFSRAAERLAPLL